MSEHEVRIGGSGELGSGELPGQENDEGPGGGPPSMDDFVVLDDLPEPEGDPVETDDLAEAREEADALELALVREELAQFAEPEGSPDEAEDDAADDDYDADADADDYEGAEPDDADADEYADADDYQDADDTGADDGGADDGGADSGYDSAGGSE